jgi:erythromycin esterase
VKDLLPGLSGLKPLSDGEKTKLRADAADASEFVEARREALLQVLTPAEYRRAHRCAVLLVQATMPGANTELELSNARDRAMAENVKWLVEEAFPNEKIVLWAHNFHAATFTPGFVPMGRHLRQTFGEQMRVFGFVFDRGEVRVLPLKDGEPDPGGSTVIKVPAATDSAEALLRATGLRRFILDLRVLPASSPLGAWMAGPQRLRMIDVSSAFDYLTPLPKAFDALVFIEESTATVPLK